MILNEDVIKTAGVGNKKGYFATFFIPPAEEDECVFQDIVKAEREWRPDTSLSHHTSTSSANRGSRSPSRARSKRVKSSRGKDAVRYDLDGDAERERASTARSLNAMSVLSGYSEHAPPPPPSRSAMRNPSPTRRRLPGRGRPIKYALDQGKAFATPKDRTNMTRDVIKESVRGSDVVSTERTCRPYSSYTVYHKKDNIAISPYGEPNLKGAAGRYREQYKSMTNSLTSPVDVSKETKDYVFKKFFENLTLRATLNCRSPIGVLKKPPPKPIRKPNKATESKTAHLHKQAQSRMSSVRKDLGSSPQIRSEGATPGVEYVIAMEMSRNLEKHRIKRSYSFPSMPTVAIATATAVRVDAPRLTTQSGKFLTAGETSIKGGIDANVYDEERSKRGPVKCIERKPRVRSPPLSKLSRDRFLPEAIRRRELEQQESLAGLRIAGANTPVTDWKTETSRRPKSTMTATTKMQLESVASKSESCGELSDFDDEDIETLEDDDDREIKAAPGDSDVEETFEKDVHYSYDVGKNVDAVDQNEDYDADEITEGANDISHSEGDIQSTPTAEINRKAPSSDCGEESYNAAAEADDEPNADLRCTANDGDKTDTIITESPSPEDECNTDDVISEAQCVAVEEAKS